jgi:hypothetical protein
VAADSCIGVKRLSCEAPGWVDNIISLMHPAKYHEVDEQRSKDLILVGWDLRNRWDGVSQDDDDNHEIFFDSTLPIL